MIARSSLCRIAALVCAGACASPSSRPGAAELASRGAPAPRTSGIRGIDVWTSVPAR